MNRRLIIVGLPIDLLTSAETDLKLEHFLATPGLQVISTLNPELVIQASRQESLKKYVHSSALVTADGSGIILMAKLTGQAAGWSERLTGVDLTRKLLDLAVQKQLRLVIIMKEPAYASPEQVTEALRRQWPGLEFELIAWPAGNQLRAPLSGDIILVTLGMPEQELWIDQHRRQLEGFKIAVGVGGTFDFLSGKIKRAPRWLQTIGLEWLWRLLLRPGRMWRRVFRALIIFPYLAWTKRHDQ